MVLNFEYEAKVWQFNFFFNQIFADFFNFFLSTKVILNKINFTLHLS